MSDLNAVVVEKVEPPQGSTPVYSASSLRLYGRPIFGVRAVMGATSVPVAMSFNAQGSGSYMPALIFGYAYQGHCYNLPEPVVMIVENKLGFPRAAVGCGYSQAGPAPNLNYLMWEVEKDDRTAQLQVTNDSYEEIILRRSMSADRPPLSYNSAVRMTHRGGRLVE